MVRVTEELAIPEQVTLYYTIDPLLANLPVLVFHGPSTTTNSTLNSSRIQIHVFTAAGFQSYPRITISPNSPLYASVDRLPRDRQGEEICRGLAFGLLKYFKELSEVAKSGLILQAATSKSKRPGSGQKLFDEQHAADLAASMIRVDNIGEILQDLEAALRPQNVGYVDVDLVLPPNSIAHFQEPDEDEELDEDEALDPTLRQYGVYAPLVKLFGDVAFLPTSKLRRAPSRPTSLHRSKSFMKDQKLSLRREMAELVDTEERYVMKMHELVNHMADEFRVKAKSRTFGSFSPSEDDLQKLFPKSLDRILVINSAFLAAIKKVMDETEEDAMQDLESPLVGSASSRHGGTGRVKDPTGALAFSKVLLEWFPQFQDCYQEYIRASQEFPQIISSFLKQPSSFSQRVQQTGEQRLRSAVIEPVQRLPRYSLFIDNIVNFLPVLHPALQSMLKARDIITAICSLDPPAADKSQVVNRLKNLVEFWPSTLLPQGRLITAIDFLELAAPFDMHQSPGSDSSRLGMFLLFADCFVILKKSRECNLSARGFLAEVDKPSAASMMASVTAAAGGQKHIYDFSFSGWHVLGDTRFTTSDDGRILSMISAGGLKDTGSGRERTSSSPSVRSFVLQGSYEAKASRLAEEIVKAKVEGRFSEAERETDTWCLRSGRLADGGLYLYTAVFAEGIDTLKKDRKEPAPIRIVVDHDKGTKGAPVGHYGVEIVANISVIGGGAKFKMEIDGLNDRVYVDDALVDTVMPIFSKRVSDLLQLQHCTSNPNLTTPFVHFHTKILRSLQLMSENEKSKSFRPSSPVKILSSFLNGGFNSSTTSFSNSVSSKHNRTPVLGSIPSMPSMSRTSSNKSMQEIDGKSSVRATLDDSRPMNPLVRLEETFTGYVAALQSRKGNVVGKILRSRGAADELAVNEVYNKFIEFPFDLRTASEAPFDVLFVAFEKFLRMAWRDQMGQVMSVQTLDSLQENALKMYAGDFADYVKMVFGEMAPQNRRAFIAIIKLLADLLDGCGNDGDRGALTAAFAELLVVEGEPHNYINLLDRVVEDSDRLFDDIGPGASTNFGGFSNSAYGSVSSAHRSNPSATGSLTSNASSLRRRFADTLLRSNSSNKDRPSMWRTLSKNDRHVATGEPIQPSSLSKVSLNRSRSIESPNRRPNSRDRPTVLGAFDERPSSSHAPQPKLSPIGASPPAETHKTLKKKRRSSLSDLKSMMAAATLGGSSPLSPSPDHKTKTLSKLGSPRTPVTPSPTKIPISNGGIMDRNRNLYRTGSPDPKQKENYPSLMSPPPRVIGSLTERPQNLPSPAPTTEPVLKEAWTPRHSKTVSLSSNIPTLRGRTNSVVRPTTSAGIPNKPNTPGRLRLQSPQKLRERLKDEAKAISAAEESLQTELSKIGEEMARLNNSSSSSPSLQKVSTQMKNIESRIPILVSDLTSRNEALKQDMEKSIEGLETKVKGLDQLYKESSAENELLYEKFNGELGKIVKALKGKGKEDKEELITKMKEASEEAAKTKKENARLRREIVTLRTLLKAAE